MSGLYTREELIEICEKSSVLQENWTNRDSADAQRQVGECMFLLKAGCEFEISSESDERTIWLEIKYEGFEFWESGHGKNIETYYLPTIERLESRDGMDWY